MKNTHVHVWHYYTTLQEVNHTLQGTSQLLLHCTQSVERARSLINAHLSGREKPSPQSIPWPSLLLLQLDFTLQWTFQLFLHTRSLINAHPNGREKPSPQSVSWPSLLHTLAAASVDTLAIMPRFHDRNCYECGQNPWTDRRTHTHTHQPTAITSARVNDPDIHCTVCVCIHLQTYM